LLALDLADAGFDFSVLREFRARLLQHGATERLLARPLCQTSCRLNNPSYEFEVKITSCLI
jgi:hypothetical protein